MGRRRKPASQRTKGEVVKISVLIPWELNGRLEEACRRGGTTVSDLVRRLLGRNLGDLLAEPPGRQAGGEPPHVPPPGRPPSDDSLPWRL
jgi:hypothetical protein